MFRITHVRPLPRYRVWLHFDDGVEGEVDLSELVGQGVFAAWEDPARFAQVSVEPDTHALTWPGGIDLCPHALHDDLVTRASRAADGAPGR
jgi:hypothetical protein